MPELKYIIFFVFLLFGVPLCTATALASKKAERSIFFLMMAFSSIAYFTSINFMSFETYKGTVRGIEIVGADLFTLSLFFAMLLKKSNGKGFALLFPGIFFYLIYLLFSAISIYNAQVKLYAFAELWKMARILFFMLVTYNYLRRTNDYMTILNVLIFIATITFFYVTYQRYIVKRYQPAGIFAHQNSMSMYMAATGTILFSCWLNLRSTKWRNMMFMFGFLFASGAAVFSLSRGTLFFYPLSCTAVLFFSLKNNFQKRHLKILVALMFISFIAALKFLPNIIDRFEHAPESSKDMRVRLAKAAVMIANEKPLGCGLNNWSQTLATTDKYMPDNQNLKDDKKIVGLVETTYLLVAAECGWITLFFLLVLFAYYMLTAFFLIGKFKNSELMCLPLGICFALFENYSQSILEWVLKQQPNFYLLGALFATVAALKMFAKTNSKDSIEAFRITPDTRSNRA